jgi:hypothetical protein
LQWKFSAAGAVLGEMPLNGLQLDRPVAARRATGVRALEEDDLPAVAALFERIHRSGTRVPAPGLAALFGRTLLTSPWRDPEIPSLVYEADGAVRGFIGLHVRRISFDGRAMRMAFPAHLMADPDLRGMPAGALLLRRALEGPQDVTLSTAGTGVSRMWERLGGVTLGVSSVGWARCFRPAALLGELALERVGRDRLTRGSRPVLELVDRVAGRRALAFATHLGGRGQVVEATEPMAGTTTEPLTARHVVEHGPELTGGARVRVDYDEAFLEWLFAEMASVTGRGELVGRLVRGADGRALGWYVGFFHPTRFSRVLQVVAPARHTGTVLDHLFAEAERRGTPAVRGRVETQLLPALWERPCLLLRETRDLVHTRDPALLDAIRLGDAVVTPMDGEAWMGHHLDPLTTGGRR